jgi:hypothetical protein
MNEVVGESIAGQVNSTAADVGATPKTGPATTAANPAMIERRTFLAARFRRQR